MDPRLDVPVRNLKCKLPVGEDEVQFLNPEAGEALTAALAICQMEPKWTADELGISHSLLLRGLKSEKGISFHKLWDLPDAFWLELLFIVARMKKIAKVRRGLEEA